METNLLETTHQNIVKVAVLGPECTGKTTLCKALATYFKTQWVPEYMREYLQHKWDLYKKTCSWEDLFSIAKGQVYSENQSAKQAREFLFCDTTLFELMVYSYIYYGKCLPEIEFYALKNQYDFVFLTDIDVPWQADDLRDKPNEREEVLQIFKDFLNRYNIPYTHLKGNPQQRLQKVVQVIKKSN